MTDRAELPEDEDLWPLRLEGEPPKAFLAFRTYRDMGPGRSLRRTCAQVYGFGLDEVTPKRLATAMRTAARWSSRWRWVERAEEHDRQVDRLAQASAASDLAKMRIAHAAGGREMFRRALERVELTDVDEITPAQARLWLLTGAALERGARADDTLRIEHSGEIGTVETLRGMFAAVMEEGAAAIWGDDEGDA